LSESVGAGGPVVTITPDGNTAINPGLAATETIMLGFDITTNDAGIGFSGVDLSTVSSLSGLVTSATVAEEDCFGGLLPGPSNLLSLGNGGLACTPGGLSVGASVALTPGVNVDASVPIPLIGAPVQSVDVLKEINLVAALGGSVSISSIGQSFATESNGAAAPEPGSFLLGGFGLLGAR
jgi:hypothetical protein